MGPTLGPVGSSMPLQVLPLAQRMCMDAWSARCMLSGAADRGAAVRSHAPVGPALRGTCRLLKRWSAPQMSRAAMTLCCMLKPVAVRGCITIWCSTAQACYSCSAVCCMEHKHQLEQLSRLQEVPGNGQQLAGRALKRLRRAKAAPAEELVDDDEGKAGVSSEAVNVIDSGSTVPRYVLMECMPSLWQTSQWAPTGFTLNAAGPASQQACTISSPPCGSLANAAAVCR